MFTFSCYCTFLLYFNFYTFLSPKNSPQWKCVHHQAKKIYFVFIVSTARYRVLFVNQFLQLQRHFLCTCVDHNVRLIIAMVYTKDAEKGEAFYGKSVDNLQMLTKGFCKWENFLKSLLWTTFEHKSILFFKVHSILEF